MSGWRAKIGIISVIGDSFEGYVHSVLPEGVSVISTKLPNDYTTADLVSAFRCFMGHNADGIIFAGRETIGELTGVLEQSGIDLDRDLIITRREVVEDFIFSLMEDEQGGLLLISPNGADYNWSDVSWMVGIDRVTASIIPLTGVTDEGLMIEDATDYWKYHRIMDATDDPIYGSIDNVYVEDLKLGVTNLAKQLSGALKKKVYSTQELLWDAVLKKCKVNE